MFEGCMTLMPGTHPKTDIPSYQYKIFFKIKFFRKLVSESGFGNKNCFDDVQTVFIGESRNRLQKHLKTLWEDVLYQFPDSPLNGDSQNTILKMCIASLVHHHDDIVRLAMSYSLASSFSSIFLIKHAIKRVITDLNSPVHFNLIQYLTLPFLNCFEIEFLFLFLLL